MIDLSYTVETFLVPIAALLIPLAMFGNHLRTNKLTLSLTRGQYLKFFTLWGIFTVSLFIFLIWLTGGINVFFKLEKGIHITDRDLVWNITEQISFIFVFNPGISLLVVAILAGLLYATILGLPKICTLVPKRTLTGNEISTSSGATASVSSGFSAAASAVTSTAVCCSTSTISFLAPSIAAFVAPYAFWLLVGSLTLLIYSFRSVVLPRFPLLQANSEKYPVSR